MRNVESEHKKSKAFFNFLRWQLFAPPKHQRLLEELHEDPYYFCGTGHHRRKVLHIVRGKPFDTIFLIAFLEKNAKL